MTISFGGVLAGGLAGAGTAAEQVGQSTIDHDNRVSLMQATQQAEADKQMAIAQAQKVLNDQSRTEMAAKINAGAGGILAQGQADKLNNYGSQHQLPAGATGPILPTDNTPDNLTPDQRAMVPSSNAERSSALAMSAKQSGYVSGNELASTDASLTRANAIADARMYGADSRARSAENVANIGADSRESIAETRAKAAAAKVSALNPVDRATLEQARSYDRDIAANRQMISKANDQLAVTSSADKPALQKKIDDWTADSVARQTKRDALLKKSAEAFSAFRATKSADAAAGNDDEAVVAASPPETPSAPAASAPTAAGLQSAMQKYQQSLKAGQ